MRFLSNYFLLDDDWDGSDGSSGWAYSYDSTSYSSMDDSFWSPSVTDDWSGDWSGDLFFDDWGAGSDLNANDQLADLNLNVVDDSTINIEENSLAGLTPVDFNADASSISTISEASGEPVNVGSQMVDTLNSLLAQGDGEKQNNGDGSVTYKLKNDDGGSISYTVNPVFDYEDKDKVGPLMTVHSEVVTQKGMNTNTTVMSTSDGTHLSEVTTDFTLDQKGVVQTVSREYGLSDDESSDDLVLKQTTTQIISSTKNVDGSEESISTFSEIVSADGTYASALISNTVTEEGKVIQSGAILGSNGVATSLQTKDVTEEYVEAAKLELEKMNGPIPEGDGEFETFEDEEEGSFSGEMPSTFGGGNVLAGSLLKVTPATPSASTQTVSSESTQPQAVVDDELPVAAKSFKVQPVKLVDGDESDLGSADTRKNPSLMNMDQATPTFGKVMNVLDVSDPLGLGAGPQNPLLKMYKQISDIEGVSVNYFAVDQAGPTITEGNVQVYRNATFAGDLWARDPSITSMDGTVHIVPRAGADGQKYQDAVQKGREETWKELGIPFDPNYVLIDPAGLQRPNSAPGGMTFPGVSFMDSDATNGVRAIAKEQMANVVQMQSFVEGGNTRNLGDGTAIVGMDAVYGTAAMLNISKEEATQKIAADLGVSRIVALPGAAGEFHVDMTVVPTPSGVILVNDPSLGANLTKQHILEEAKANGWSEDQTKSLLSRVDENSSSYRLTTAQALSDASAKKLEDAGYKVQRVPGAIEVPTLDGKANLYNMLNMVGGISPKTGDNIGIVGGAPAIFQNNMEQVYKNNGVARVYFADPEISNIMLGGGSGGGQNCTTIAAGHGNEFDP